MNLSNPHKSVKVWSYDVMTFKTMFSLWWSLLELLGYVSCRSESFDCVSWLKNSIWSLRWIQCFCCQSLSLVLILNSWFHFLHLDCCFVAEKLRLLGKASLVPFGTAGWSWAFQSQTFSAQNSVWNSLGIHRSIFGIFKASDSLMPRAKGSVILRAVAGRQFKMKYTRSSK